MTTEEKRVPPAMGADRAGPRDSFPERLRSTITHPPMRAASAVAVLAILAIAVGFFNPIFRGQTFSDVGAHQTALYPWRAYPSHLQDLYPQSDEADAFYPWQVLIDRSVQNGHMPYWDPYTFGGSPFFNNGNSGPAYPVRLALSAVVSAPWAHDLFVLIHLILAGLFMFVFMRSLGAGRLASLMSASAWMLNSFSLAWAQLEHVLVVTAYLPGAVWLMRRAALAAGSAALLSAIGCAALLALMILGGNSEFVLLAYIVVVGYGLALAAAALRHRASADRGRSRRLRPFALVLLGAGLSLGLAGVSLLPTALTFRDIARVPLSYHNLVHEFAVPLRAFGAMVRPPGVPLTSDAMNSHMVYMGVAVALLAVFGALQRRPGSGFARILAATTALVVLGTPLTWVAYHTIPGFGYFRPLGRALFLWNFAVAILAGLGLDALLLWVRNRTRASSPPRGAILAGAIGCAAVLATTVQSAVYGRDINPPFQARSNAELYPRTPLIRALLRQQAQSSASFPQRILPVRRAETSDVPWTPPTFYANTSTVFGLQSAAGYESILPSRTANLWRVVEGLSPRDAIAEPLQSAYIPSFFTSTLRFDLLARAGVTTIVAPPDIARDKEWVQRSRRVPMTQTYAGKDGRLFRLRHTLPRAFVVHQVDAVATPTQALSTFTAPGFDARKAVVLESRSQPAATVGAASASSGEVATSRTTWNGESYSVDARSPGWLVVLGSWDRGWSASVNGRHAPVARADYAFRAVKIPTGRSRISFTYRPAGLRTGAVLTAAALVAALGLVSMAIVLRSRRKREA